MFKYQEFKGFIYIFFFFISFYFLLSSGRFSNGDEVNVYLTTQSLITKGELSIPRVCYPTKKGRGGKFYSHKGIGLSIAVVPYYIAGAFLEKVLPAKMITMTAREKLGAEADFFTGDIKIFAVSQFDSHLSALLCCMFYLLLLRFGFSIRTAILSALILGTSTIVCPYSKTFFPQTLACFTVLTSVYFMLLERTNLNLLLSGVFLGLSILTRIENIIIIPVFVCYIFAKEQGAIFKFKLNKEIINKMTIFLAPVIAALIFYRFVNFLKYGSVMELGLDEGLGYWLAGSFFLTGVYGHLFSVGRSIFIFSPPIIISVFYLKKFLLDHKLDATLLYAVSISFFIFYSKFIAWNGGVCWGDRYLYVIIPFLLVPLGYFLEKMFIHKTAWQLIVLGFFILTGLFVQVLGTATWMYGLFRYDLEWNRIIYNPDIDIYSLTLFIPKVSPIPLHWKLLSAGKYIDYWFYHIYINHGFRWMIFFMIFPLTGLALSARGILKIAVSPDKAKKYHKI